MKALALVIALNFSVTVEPVGPSPAPEPVITESTGLPEPVLVPPADDTDGQSPECVLLQEFC